MHTRTTGTSSTLSEFSSALIAAAGIFGLGAAIILGWSFLPEGYVAGQAALAPAWVLLAVLSTAVAVVIYTKGRHVQRLQAQRLEDQQRSQAYLNALPDLIFLVDSKGACTDFRLAPNAPPLLTSEQLLNGTIWEFLPKQSAETMATAIQATFDSRSTHSVEIDLAKSKSRTRQIEARLVPYNSKEVLVIIREVSDEHYMRRVLRELAEHISTKTGDDYFKSMVSFLSQTLHADYVLVGTMDPNAPYRVNCLAGTEHQRLISDSLSFDLEKLPGSRTLVGKLELIVPAGLRSTFPGDKKLNSNEVGTLAMLPLEDSGGAKRGVLLVINGGLDSHDQFAESIVQICADRAAGELESGTTMKALSEAVEQAEQLNQMKSNMLANLNHEFRTPMNGILGFAKILQRHIEDPEQRQYAHYIYQSAERLMATLRDVIALAKLESNEISVQWMPVSLAGEVEDLAYSYRTQVEERDLKFVVDVPTEMISCRLDASLLGQALSNLLDNSMKFTREGEIRVECLTDTIDGEAYGLIRVRDTGIGMSADFQARAFAAFTQESAGIDRHFEGSGIGLTIVQRFTTLMNGKVLIDSEQGAGSTFTLAFPLLDPEAAQREIDAISVSEPAPELLSSENLENKVRILVAEDDQGNQRLINMYLRDIADIDQAVTGEQAVELATQNEYDLILFDVNLGRGIRDGISAFHKVRELTLKSGRVPIVAMTAYTLKFTRETFLEEGFDDYIAKPFSDSAIQAMVSKSIGQVALKEDSSNSVQ